MHSKGTSRIRGAAEPRPGAGAAASHARGRSSPRRQTRQRSLARRRRRQRRRTGLSVLTLAAALAAAFFFIDPPWQQNDGVSAGPDLEQARPAPSLTAPPSPPSSPKASPSPKASVSPKPSPSKKTKPHVPNTGPGTFTVASAGIKPGAKGSAYRVEVEDGIGVDPDKAAEDIALILADPRGWNHGGAISFRQVSDNSAGLVIRIATPVTTDKLCGAYGLKTGGEVNCRGGEKVMVNLKRWLLGSPMFDGPATEYRALIINHEVGHWLGHGHETCPGPGLPAPAMMQQIKGLKGCVSNAWPYTKGGGYLGGPSVP